MEVEAEKIEVKENGVVFFVDNRIVFTHQTIIRNTFLRKITLLLKKEIKMRLEHE